MQTEDRQSGREAARSKWADLVLCVGLGVLLLVPGTLARWRATGPLAGEQRMARPWPATPRTAQACKAFPREVEAAVQDRLRFRQEARNAWAAINYRLFHESVEPRVIVGRDGWLFYNSRADPVAGREDTVADALEARPVQDRSIAELVAKQQRRAQWLAERGGRYLFVAVPDKSSVYHEHGPDWFAKRGPGRPLRQFDRIWATQPDGERTWVNLEPALLAAKGVTNLYYTTDTHWNQVGALMGAREIVRRLQVDYPDLLMPAWDHFTTTWHHWGGLDLGRMLGPNEMLHELHPVLVARPDLPLSDTQRKLKVLIYHDSFGDVLKAVWPAYFPNTEFRLYQRFDRAEIEALHPDIVLTVIVERSLREPGKY